MEKRDTVIVSAVRTPIGRAKKGIFAKTRPDDLFEKTITSALKKLPEFDYKEIDDIRCGCAFPEAEQGMNVARLSAILAGLPVDVPATTFNRFCGSAMTALHTATHAIWADDGDVFIVGGTETMSLIPMGGNKFSPNPRFTEDGNNYPDVFISMGETAENVVDRYKKKYPELDRETLDKFGYSSQIKALSAQKEGRFDDEIVKLIVNDNGEVRIYDEKKGIPQGWKLIDKDDGPRADTTLEALAKLKPAFRTNGYHTAGNSSQVSDGASAMVVMSSDKAKKLGITPLAKIVATGLAGLEPEVMGLGPIPASRKALKKAGISIKDIKLVEFNEAFASQSLVSIWELGLTPDIVNVNGGAIALGHPLGISGTRIITTLLHEMRRRKLSLGLAAMCIGGGQGIATIIETV